MGGTYNISGIKMKRLATSVLSEGKEDLMRVGVRRNCAWFVQAPALFIVALIISLPVLAQKPDANDHRPPEGWFAGPPIHDVDNDEGNWLMYGGNLRHTFSNPKSRITPKNAASLKLAWSF